jgi:hypothetical protein
MPRPFRSVSRLLAGLTLLAGLLVLPNAALADKLHLRDGTVVTGTVVREEGDFYVVEIIKDGKKVTEFIAKDDVRKVERDAPKPNAPKPETVKPETGKPEPAKPDAPKPEAAKPEASKPETPKPDGAAPSKDKPDPKAARQLTGKANRVAFLNFGGPRAWQGEIDSMVGRAIVSSSWRKVIPMLEKDNVDTVVVRINSGGGYTAEMMPFNQIFQFEYKPRFRTVLWVESAISCAAMSPWPIEEIYMTPGGNIGGCTEWYGNLQLSDPVSQETRLAEMEQASAWAKRSPFIMRSMQIREPLSCNVNEDGSVDWFQDLSGKIVVNPIGEILTMTPNLAVQTKFAKGIAATPEELMQLMGINEFVIAGKDATNYIDNNMRDCHNTFTRIQELDSRYGRAVQAAAGIQDRNLRMGEVGVARGALRDMQRWMSVNPNFVWILNRPPQWFRQQEDILRELSR